MLRAGGHLKLKPSPTIDSLVWCSLATPIKPRSSDRVDKEEKRFLRHGAVAPQGIRQVDKMYCSKKIRNWLEKNKGWALLLTLWTLAICCMSQQLSLQSAHRDRQVSLQHAL